jgi:hypothetical protein
MSRKIIHPLKIIHQLFTGLHASEQYFYIDYSQPIEKLIVSGNYYRADPAVNNQNLPPIKYGRSRKLIGKIYDFRQCLSKEEVIERLKKDGFRPGTASEAVCFGAEYPEEQKKRTIIAFGSIWRDEFNRPFVILLNFLNGKREINIESCTGQWGARCGFLAVRKPRIPLALKILIILLVIVLLAYLAYFII